MQSAARLMIMSVARELISQKGLGDNSKSYHVQSADFFFASTQSFEAS
jgi:hypothetical protein